MGDLTKRLALAILAALALAFLMALAFPGRAQAETPTGLCLEIDTQALIVTTQGYAVTDMAALVALRDVRYWDGPAIICIPPRSGGPILFLPRSSWPGFAAVTTAHGVYAWIDDFNYKAVDGSHCCGWNDCRELQRSDVQERRDGFMTPGGLVDPKAVYQSRDGKVWLCRTNKCLFLPEGG